MVIPLGSFISRLWTGGFVSRRPCSFLDCARRGGARGVLGVLTIYTNHPGGNLMQKHDIWRNGRMTRYQVYSNQLNRLKRAEYCIALNHSPRFLKLVLNEMTRTIDFPAEFPVFPWHLAPLVFWAMRESPGTGSYHCEEEKQKRIKKRHETLSVYSSDLDFMSFSLASISTTAAFLCCICERSRDHRWSKLKRQNFEERQQITYYL